VIDEELYNKYKALGEKYGIDNFVYIDECGRYRGEAPTMGSVDNCHVSGAKQGISFKSSLVEHIIDDGSNQYGPEARLHKITDNGDGTTTLVYKEMQAEAGFKLGSYTHGHLCRDFEVGDKVFAYTPTGEILCETEALTATVEGETVYDKITNVHGSVKDGEFRTFSIKIKSSEFNFKAAEGYDLSDNTHVLKNRLTIENLSKTSSNYTFDNVLFRNTPCRGNLIKTTDVTIKNCTYRNLSATGILIFQEPDWGEGTMGRHIRISNCLFDYTGFNNKEYEQLTYAPISIKSPALGVKPVANNIVMSDIKIDGCHFTNGVHHYGITIQGARDIEITNNVFGEVHGVHAEDNMPIYMNTALNVKIEGNTFNSRKEKVKDTISATNIVNIYGKDVEGENAISDNISQ
jgi:hypothetical protein